MGTWGYGIFDDDLAMDIRSSFGGALSSGASLEKATEQVLEEYAEELRDLDEGPIVYLALAALHSERGRVLASVRQRALRTIERGEGLARWEEEGQEAVQARKRVLEYLRQSLTSIR